METYSHLSPEQTYDGVPRYRVITVGNRESYSDTLYRKGHHGTAQEARESAQSYLKGEHRLAPEGVDIAVVLDRKQDTILYEAYWKNGEVVEQPRKEPLAT